jgi:hypothetical protein
LQASVPAFGGIAYLTPWKWTAARPRGASSSSSRRRSIGLGALAAASDAVTPMSGTLVMGLYAAALVGIGLAIGGLFRASIAAEVVALIVDVTYLI